MSVSFTATTRGGDSLDSAVSKVKRHVLPLFIIMFMVNYILAAALVFLARLQPKANVVPRVAVQEIREARL
jgi:hypothetical protein